MTGLLDGMVLYHGSYTKVEKPDLARCAKYKDFGRGFYLTSSYLQAQSFAKLSLRKARENDLVPKEQLQGFVSSFRVRLTNEKAVKMRFFPTADTDWLKCVSAHRKRGAFKDVLEELRAYDVIVGKVANDQTNNTLTTYLSGGYGPFESEGAMRLCIGLLLPDRLEDQYCFRSSIALSLLEFDGCEAVRL